MNASVLALLLAASSSSPVVENEATSTLTSTSTSTSPPTTLASTSWSIGGGLGYGGGGASIERRITGPVWIGLNLGGGGSLTGYDVDETRAGNTLVAGDEGRSWYADIGVRFRLQLAPDDSFLRPSVFLGAGVGVGGGSSSSQESADGTEPITFVSDRFSMSTTGSLGVMLDFTVLPWLALRTGTTLVSGGYSSFATTTSNDDDVRPAQSTDHSASFSASVALAPTVGVQAFF